MTTAVEDYIREQLLQGDIAILNEHGVRDNVLSLLAAEHAARCETFAKMVEPTLGRAFLLVAAGALLAAAEQIAAATFQEPELTTVGA